MPLKAQLPQKTQRELIPTGNYPARVYEIIELGTVDSTWMGEAKKTHKVRIGFELPTEKRVFDETKGEQPMVISKEMALSFGDLAGLSTPQDTEKGVFPLVICEGCGPIQVDHFGNCVSEDCLCFGLPGHGLKKEGS